MAFSWPAARSGISTLDTEQALSSRLQCLLTGSTTPWTTDSPQEDREEKEPVVVKPPSFKKRPLEETVESPPAGATDPLPENAIVFWSKTNELQRVKTHWKPLLFIQSSSQSQQEVTLEHLSLRLKDVHPLKEENDHKFLLESRLTFVHSLHRSCLATLRRLKFSQIFAFHWPLQESPFLDKLEGLRMVMHPSQPVPSPGAEKLETQLPLGKRNRQPTLGSGN